MKNYRAWFYAVSALILCIILFSSCCKMADCERSYTRVTFVNLSNPKVTDTFYLRRYKLNTNFTIKLDTAIYIKNKNFYVVEFRRDSTVVSPITFNTPKLYFVDQGYDYELVLPAIGKVSRMSEIVEENFEERFCGMARQLCYTQIRSAKVDGVTYYGSAVIKN